MEGSSEVSRSFYLERTVVRNLGCEFFSWSPPELFFLSRVRCLCSLCKPAEASSGPSFGCDRAIPPTWDLFNFYLGCPRSTHTSVTSIAAVITSDNYQELRGLICTFGVNKKYLDTQGWEFKIPLLSFNIFSLHPIFGVLLVHLNNIEKESLRFRPHDRPSNPCQQMFQT